MKSASQLKDLEQFGIKILTGEADALGFRILCDLDHRGLQVFKECFGMPYIKSTEPYGMAENWNSGSIASVMLTGHDVVPLAVIGFYLQGKTVLITKGKNNYESAIGLDAMEDVVLDVSGEFYNFVDYAHDKGAPQRWPDAYGRIIRIIRQRKSDGDRVQGTRNVHQMSGRAT